MVQLLRRRPDFRRLWLADAVSLIGDWLSYVAIAVLIVESDGGWLGLAFVYLLHTLPGSLLSPLAGWLTDRMDTRALMVASATARGLLTLAMTLAAAQGELVWLQVGLFARMAASATEHTAGRAALKRLVAADELGLANAIGGATWSVLFAAGVAVGGIVTSRVGPVVALLLDAGTFFLSAVLLLRLPRIPKPQVEARAGEPEDRGGLDAALALALRVPGLRALVCGKLPIALAGGGAWVYLNEVAETRPTLGDTALSIGLLQAARAVGTGLGPFAQRRFDGGHHRGPGAVAVVWLGFLGIAAFHQSDGPLFLVLSALAWGMSAGANWVNTTAGLLLESPVGMEGRLSALDVITQNVGLCGGAVLGAALGEHFGSTVWLVFAPLCLGVLAWLLTQRPTWQGGETGWMRGLG